MVVQRLHPRVAPGLETVEAKTHGVRIRLDLRDYIQQRIYYESHEPVQLAFLERFLRPGDIVLDAGAHVGIFTLVAAASVQESGEVHSFEPVPNNFESLQLNVSLNGFENVTLNRAAVGAESGSLELGLPSAVPDTGTTSAMYTVGGAERRVSAPLVALDDYVKERIGDRPIRLLKMDVEGFEPAVLEGLGRRLASAPPDCVMLEVNFELLDRHGFQADAISKCLVEAGYRLYRPNAFGRLHKGDGRVSPEVASGPLPQPSGLTGWLRRYRAEGQIFFNLFAIQPGIRW
jgi:FkbM family methyltransferase